MLLGAAGARSGDVKDALGASSKAWEALREGLALAEAQEAKRAALADPKKAGELPLDVLFKAKGEAPPAVLVADAASKALSAAKSKCKKPEGQNTQKYCQRLGMTF